jgi:predicted TIM-barrel fold metal-dependent hydrolase
VIDGHVHIWPDAIAERALRTPAAELPRFGDGTQRGYEEAMRSAGVNRAAVLAVAHKPEAVAAANDFVSSLHPGHFIPVGTIHPRLAISENHASLQAAGVRAVKLHPLYQGYALDDRALGELLDSLQGKYVFVVHVGAGGESHPGAACTPAMLVKLLRRFPRLQVIACHFGGYRALDEAERTLVGLPIYLDTSWPPGLGTLDTSRVRQIIARHGPDRIVFGSDWPMADPAAEIDALTRLNLPGDQLDDILGRTISRLLGLVER